MNYKIVGIAVLIILFVLYRYSRDIQNQILFTNTSSSTGEVISSRCGRIIDTMNHPTPSGKGVMVYFVVDFGDDEIKQVPKDSCYQLPTGGWEYRI